MAQPMICDTCRTETATCLITLIAEAEVNAFCPGCFTDFCQAFITAYRPEVLAPPPAKPKRPPRKKPAAALADGATGGESDERAGHEPAGTAAG